MKIIGYIGGIPFNVVNEADEKAFAPMFPAFTSAGQTFPPDEEVNTGKASLFKDSPLGEYWDKDLVLHISEADKYKNVIARRKCYYHIEKDTDGVKLIDLYQNDKSIPDITRGSFADNLLDIKFYYETDDTSNVFGGVCFAKMNTALRSYFLNNPSTNWLVDEIVKEQKGAVKASKLRAAIEHELEPVSRFDVFSKIGSALLLQLAESIRGMKYTEKAWNPFTEKYTPLLSAKDLEATIKAWNSFKENSTGFVKSIHQAREWLQSNGGIAGEILSECLQMITDLLALVIDAVDIIMEGIKAFVTIIKLSNAFLVGVVNECIELVAGLFDLCALALTLTDKAERQKTIETIENILEVYEKDPSIITKQINKAFDALRNRYSKDKSEYEIAYQLGEDTVVVITIVELIGAVIKGLRNPPKAFKKMEEWLKK